MIVSMKILAFSASLRKDSRNTKLVRIAATVARKAGAEVDSIDLNGFLFPPYDHDLEISGQWPDNLEPLRAQLASHEALMIASPEYNYSMPGHFKNTFDWISRLRPVPWKGKIVLLMSASPGLAGGNRGLWALRVPFEACGAVVHPDMFSLGLADQAFHESGELKDAKSSERLGKTVTDFVGFATKLTR